MLGKVITIGEPMAMFVAQTPGKLKDVTGYDRFIAGAEVNVAVGTARLGHEVQYITHLGEDPFGEYIHDFLKKEKIDTELVCFDPEHPTGFQLKNKGAKNDPEVVYFRRGSAAYHMDQEKLKDIDFSEADIFHVTGILMALNDTTFHLVKQLIAKAKEQETVIVFDPNLRPALWKSQKLMIQRINEIARYADYFLPGIEEGAILSGKITKEDIADYYLDMGINTVIIKTGEKGAYSKLLCAKKSQVIEKAGFHVEKVIDTVGAGDGFAVGIVTGLMEKLSIEEMLERANAIGAIQVSHISDNENLPNKKHLEDFIEQHKEKEGINEITSCY